VTDKLRSVLDGAAARPAPAQTSDASNQKSSETTAQSEPSLNSSRFKKASAGGFKSTFVSSTATATATPASAPASDQAVPVGDDEDLDGEAMDPDLDGEAMDEDLDGEAMDADEDLDGEAM
jgi:U2-associated protein SR140